MSYQWPEAGDGCRRRFGGICWLSWLVAFGAVSVITALVVIPIRTFQVEQRVHNEMREYAEPASLALTSLLTSLLRYQQVATVLHTMEDRHDTSAYRQEYAVMVRSLQSIEPVSSRLGAESARSFEALRQSIQAGETVMSGAERSALLRSALDHALHLQNSIRLDIAQRYSVIGGTHRRELRLIGVTGAMALIIAFAALSLFEHAERRRDKLTRVLKLRDEVFRVVSHDLSNPLNTIHLAAARWRRIAPVEEQQFLTTILRAVQRMDRLVHDLRETAAMESGQVLACNIQTVEVRPILEEVCDSAEFLANHKAIRIRCDVPDQPILVRADRDRLFQVLGNIVDNAVKFTARNGLIILSCERLDSAVLFCVNDNGPGIEANDLPHVFNLYWQAPATAYQGAGLGLATARRIVEQHGGRIWVESHSGEGTKFLFTIPSADNVRHIN